MKAERFLTHWFTILRETFVLMMLLSNRISGDAPVDGRDMSILHFVLFGPLHSRDGEIEEIITASLPRQG